ncbi:MAG: hypothetical protein IT440_05175, partial [Phycisphaeraceae bacterium]|nr:hypothetical protein [Phycisphaeraceae bacterium]
MLDPAGLNIMHEHEERAESVAWLVYVTAAAGLAALAVMKWKPKWQRPAAIIVAGLTLLCVVATLWVAAEGGQIRHLEFRAAPAETAAP